MIKTHFTKRTLRMRKIQSWVLTRCSHIRASTFPEPIRTVGTRVVVDFSRQALARKMATAGYLRHLVLPVLYSGRPRTYVREHVWPRHLTRVFNATGHGISAWTRTRARASPESQFKPRARVQTSAYTESLGGSA